ncbi:WxL protein peptidoglycan domain-containing protein [Agromyces sp. NPDC057865]|uniref:WxL protein peptidoglycan domain-containing protein n=1 Tax=Agromyces sp. NPDC057865 TaxID=3346267 RepID=UPI00366B6F7D
MTASAQRARRPRPATPILRAARVSARGAAAVAAVAIAAGALSVASAAGPAASAPPAVSAAPASAPAAAAATDAAWDVATIDGPYGAGRANYDYSVEPGDRIDDEVLVANTGDARIEVRLYAADAFTTEAGQLDLRTSGHEPIGVGAWLALPAAEVALEAGESAEVPFAITVPRDARGEYVGGIVTTVPAASADSGVEHRAAIRVRLHVGGTFHPRLSVEDVRVGYSPELLGAGTATVTYTIRNTGDTVLAAEQSVALSGPFGLTPRTAGDLGNTPELLPGESWSVSAPIDDVGQVGTLSAAVTAVPLYTDPAGSTGPLDAVGASGLGWAIPWIPLLAVLVVAAGAVVLARRWRARRIR